MVPTTAEFNRQVENIGSTTVTFSPSVAKALWVFPIKVPFAATPAVTFTDATALADFDAGGPMPIAAGARLRVMDPLTGLVKLLLPPPVGGLIWVPGGPDNLPQTIYGVALSDSSVTVEGANLLASALLPEPVTLSDEGQELRFDEPNITYNPAMVQ